MWVLAHLCGDCHVCWGVLQAEAACGHCSSTMGRGPVALLRVSDEGASGNAE